MRTSILSRCLLFLAFVFATLAPVGQAAVSTIYYQSGPAGTIVPPSGYVGFEVPPERAGHSFRVYLNGSLVSVPFTRVPGLITTAGSGGDAQVRSLLVAARPSNTDPVTSWKIWDKTANQETPVFTTAVNVNTTVSVLDAQWTTITGVPNRYFAIPNTRAGHGLIFGTPGGAWAAVSTMYLVGTYSAGTTGEQVLLPWYTAFATAPVATSATDFLADRTTSEKVAVGVGDVRAAAVWSPDTAAYPLTWMQVPVEAREAGHAFTVHGTAPGAPEQLLRVTARADGTGAVLGFALGTGTDFWITRDAEDGVANQPAAPATGFWAAAPGSTYSAVGFFPDPPVRISTLELHEFRINARTRPNHTFSVRTNDGYSLRFGPTAIPGVSAYAPDQIDGWLDNGVANPVPVYTFTALLDPTAMITLLDENNGTQLGVSADGNRTDWLDGWQPALVIPQPSTTAPAYPSISLRTPSAHVLDYYRLRRLDDDGWSSYLGATGFGSSRTLLSLTDGTSPRTGLDGMANYTLEHSTAGFSHPLPAEAGPFLVENMTTNQTRDGVFAGFNDLCEWFEPPKPIALQISSSRWGHRLVVRHPNGEFFPIQNGSIAGNTSAPATGPAWYQSYYYFDASAVARSELPWYVEDVDTGERLGAANPWTPTSTGTIISNTTASVTPINPLAGPINSALINWISVPTPGPLSTQGDGVLRWPLPYGVSGQGSFEVERKLGGQQWALLTPTVPATAADATNIVHFTDNAPEIGYIHSYRVRYAFGDGSARRLSAPSNTVMVLNWLDNNGGGIPGALDPEDPDGDGVLNGEEGTRGTNPYWKDNPAVGLAVFGYATP